MRLALPLLAIILLVTATSAPAATGETDAIAVDHPASTVKVRRFDPDNPPRQMRKLSGDEAAYCESSFAVAASITYVVVTDPPPPAGHVRLRVEKVEWKLALDITLWLPDDATDKLIAHEHAHRQIAQRIYATAPDAARKAAAGTAGRTLNIKAKSPAAASDQIVNRLCQDYLAAVAHRSARVNRHFDRLTDHGRNDLPEDKAIARAFDADKAR